MLRIPKRKEAVARVIIEPDQNDRRLDNFLRARFRDIPKSRIYQMIRKGEVRVNGGRVKPDYRVQSGDQVRVPPISRLEPRRRPAPPPDSHPQITSATLYEDGELLILNKPSGFAVHGGTGRPFGIIDVLRQIPRYGSDLQLVHRLDRETSGCLLLAKNHSCLRRLHQLLRDGKIQKHYLALLRGRLAERVVTVDLPLKRSERHVGRHVVEASDTGKPAHTRFIRQRLFRNATLAHVETATGRTHQIRVHASLIGHPVAGDHRYGDREFNRQMRPHGLRRMFLHASSVHVPRSGTGLTVDAPLPEDLARFLDDYA